MNRNPRLACAAMIATLALAAAGGSTSAVAASCGNTGAGFSQWLSAYKSHAQAAGISKSTIDRALSGVSYDSRVIRHDRSQKSFKLSFEQFYKRRVGSYLMKKADARLKKYANLLSRIEKRFGVPPEIVIAIWGLETNFGADGAGKYSIIQSIATLAYDCRRSQFFTENLDAALRIVQKGDMSPSEMKGGWAGEIGQVQFLPASYDRYAVDFDGDGRRDLVHSVPDALASVANFLKGHGWQAGAGYGEGTKNYEVIRDWNRAGVYVKTISLMASRLR